MWILVAHKVFIFVVNQCFPYIHISKNNWENIVNFASLSKPDFSPSWGLQKNMENQNEVEVFSCKISESTFWEGFTLKSHMLTHNGEKPFSCKICGYTFSMNSSLKIHMWTYRGEKQFSCEFCEYTCSYVYRYIWIRFGIR